MMPKDLPLAVFIIIATVAVAVADRMTKGRLRTPRVAIATFAVALIIAAIYVLLSH